MPFVGKMMGGVDFGQLYHNLGDKTYETLAAATEAGAPIVKYGSFIQSIIDFLIIAFTIFLVVKAMNKAQNAEPEEEAPAEPSEDVLLLREIRDSLKK